MAGKPAEPPRVLHLGKFFPPYRGGMETFLRSFVTAQQREGLTVSTLVHSSENRFFSQNERVEWRGQQLCLDQVARWFTVAFTPISPSYMLRLARAIRKFKPDVLHIHMPNPSAFFCLLLPSARRLPWVVHWHADVISSPHSAKLRLLYQLYRFPERALLRRARRIVATSPPYLQSSKPLMNWQHKCAVVPLGIEDVNDDESSGLNSNLAAVDSKTSDVISVLAVGRLTYYKGFSDLLHAMRLLPETRLTLVGDGDFREQLKALAKELCLGDRVQFIHSCSDEELADHYASCDILCMSSIERTEAFGIVLLEAMRARVPCVVTDVKGSGMRWVVDSPHAGLAARVGDAKALARKISLLSGDPSLRKRLGEYGRQRFREQFTVERCAERMNPVYREALDEHWDREVTGPETP